jgi:TolB-like protein
LRKPVAAYRGNEPYIFVSYAHEDAAIVYPEISRLVEHGFHVWYDEGIAPGLSWRDEVADALSQCAVFLYFVTPRSVASSNCRKELNFCLSRERRTLAVHLEATELPAGLELSLSDIQAIIRSAHSEQSYHEVLTSALGSLLHTRPGPDRSVREVYHSGPQADAQSVAVLPLVNRSNDPENDFLCEGVAEELIAGLANVKGLKVASQLSSFALKNQNVDAGAIGRKLQVEHILSGSIQKSGSRVRIRVLLSRVEDGSSLWSERYDRELEDIFQLQEDIARRVVDALKLELRASQRSQLLDTGTRDAQAYERFLRGLHKARRGSRRSLQQAVTYLEEAADLDPDFARVHWWLYFCYWRLIGVGLPREEMASKAEAALDRARDAGFRPPVPWIKARRDLLPDTRPDQRTLAHEACERILVPDPEWRLFEYIQFGECLMAAGLNGAACDYYELYLGRVDHDLSATWIEKRYRSLLTQLGRFDKAIELWTEFIATQPDDVYAIGSRAMVYSRTGQFEKAEADLPGLGPSSFAQLYHHYWRGAIDAARTIFSQHPWNDPERIDPHLMYWCCFLLGDIEQGLDYLEEDVRRGTAPAVFRSNLGEALPQSILREVERHPRFQAILRQLGIDDRWRGELIEMANELAAVTGIRVEPDRN